VSAPRWIDGNSSASIEHEFRTEEQAELDAKNRRSTLVGILDHVQRHQGNGLDLVILVDALDLDEELKELAGPARRSPKRHQRLKAARASAELELGPDRRLE